MTHASYTYLWEFESRGAETLFGVYGSSECSRKDASSIERDIGGLNVECPTATSIGGKFIFKGDQSDILMICIFGGCTTKGGIEAHSCYSREILAI